MMKVYICSPYRAKDSAQLDRNIEYAQALTKQAIEAGLAPITPRLYMTQCLNENKSEERAMGLAAGMELLKICDFVIVGVKYGISEGMSAEIATADAAGIDIVNADKLCYYIEREKSRKEMEAKAATYAKQHACNFCMGSHFHSCTGYTCKEPHQQAYEYAMKYLMHQKRE